MLQENTITGLFFLAGLFIGNWHYGLAAFLASAVGTLTAILLKYDKKEIDAGLYGFSAALVGVVLLVFFQSTVLTWTFVVIGAFLAAVLQHFFIQKKFPAYTFPFILVAWVIIFLVKTFSWIPPTDIISSFPEFSSLVPFLRGTNGFGEVIFQGHYLVGILFFVGVLIHSRPAAFCALAGSFLGAWLALAVEQPLADVNLGIYGFNPVLTAIVFAGHKKIDALWVLIGVVITVFIQVVLVNSEILVPFGGVLTFPFVAGTWVTLILRNLTSKKEITQD